MNSVYVAVSHVLHELCIKLFIVGGNSQDMCQSCKVNNSECLNLIGTDFVIM